MPRIIARPGLAVDLARVAWRFRRRDWYTRLPFLPLPADDYVRWRMYTAFGTEEAKPSPNDLERYARWIAAMRPQRVAGGE
jgi:hypothetical protein